MMHQSLTAARSSQLAEIAIEPSPPALPGTWIVGWVSACIVADIVLMRAAGLTINPAAPSCLPFYAVFTLFLGLRIGLRRAATPLQRIVRDGAGHFGVFTAIVLIGATICYPIAALSHGFADDWLTRSDAAMGFHWVTWYRVVATHPALQTLGRMAYESIFISPALILGHATLFGRRDRAHSFTLSFLMAATITLSLFWFMPAVGPFAYLWHAPVDYLPISELWQPQIIPSLRAHTFHLVDVGQLRGLVSAPSFHAAAAVLFMAGAWPLRRLRWPLIAVNAAMLLATPVEGTHYLTDLVMGVAIAGFSLWTVARIGAARATGAPPVGVLTRA